MTKLANSDIMKIYEIIGEFISNTTIFEMAFGRKDVESKITGLAYPIVEHLIKVLKWKDDINKNKHVGDINSWMFKIQSFYIKGNKKPSQVDYYKWMFSDVVQNEKTLSRYIKGLYKYHDLPQIRTDDEVYDIIKNILYQISYEMPLDNFDGIETYLPE